MHMLRTKVLAIVFLLAGAAVFIYLRTWGSSGPPPQEPSLLARVESPLDPTGPLFRFGNPYLEGRSAWFRERFDAEIERLTGEGAGAAEPGGKSSAKVRREPFTDGPWLATLPSEIAAYRTEVESNAMESSFHFEVEGVDARELVLFLLFSDFRGRIEELGKIERRLLLPPLGDPPPDLHPAPALRASEFLLHEERHTPVSLALPTSVYHIERVERIGGGYAIRHEIWKNTGGSTHATVHLDSGQCFVRDTAGGSTFSFLSFYSGQKVPPFLEGMAEKLTVDSYGLFMDAVRREAPGWRPGPEALRWAESALPDDRG